MLHHPRFVAAFFSALLLGALPAHAQDAAAQGAPAQDAPAQEGPAQDAPTPEESAYLVAVNATPLTLCRTGAMQRRHGDPAPHGCAHRRLGDPHR